MAARTATAEAARRGGGCQSRCRVGRRRGTDQRPSCARATSTSGGRKGTQEARRWAERFADCEREREELRQQLWQLRLVVHQQRAQEQPQLQQAPAVQGEDDRATKRVHESPKGAIVPAGTASPAASERAHGAAAGTPPLAPKKATLRRVAQTRAAQAVAAEGVTAADEGAVAVVSRPETAPTMHLALSARLPHRAGLR